MKIVGGHPKGGIMIALIACFIIACGTGNQYSKGANENILVSSLSPIHYVAKQDTPKQKRIQAFDPVKVNAIINRLPIAMDRLDRVSEKLDNFIKHTAARDSQFNIMFNVANQRRVHIATMKVDSAERAHEQKQRDDSLLRVLNRMSSNQEAASVFKNRYETESKWNMRILLFCCIGTLIIGISSNWNRVFKKNA